MELRIVGLFLLLAGWALMLAAVWLLPQANARVGFSLAGFAVEALGFFLLARGHIAGRKKRDA